MNRISTVLVITLLVTIVVMIAGFSLLQNEINSLKQSIPYPTQTSKPSAMPSPNITIPTVPPQNGRHYNYTVFEWTLKPENINNTNWLETYGGYNASLTWRENYLKMITEAKAFPQGTLGSLASGMLAVPAFISVDFNTQTGYTKATYTYNGGDGTPYLYDIDISYPFLKAGSTNWTETFV